MKVLILVILGLVSVQAFSQANPQIRVCQTNSGSFWALFVEDDNIGFCRYGNSLMDSMSFINYFYNETQTMAMKAFLASNGATRECSEVGAESVSGLDSNGRFWSLCRFQDQSTISELTLFMGYHSTFNQELREAL